MPVVTTKANAPVTVARGPRHVTLISVENPNTTTVTGTIHLRTGTTATEWLRFSADGQSPVIDPRPFTLEDGQEFTITLDSAPSTELNVYVT